VSEWKIEKNVAYVMFSDAKQFFPLITRFAFKQVIGDDDHRSSSRLQQFSLLISREIYLVKWRDGNLDLRILFFGKNSWSNERMLD
jgi:hypothetical protein